MERYFLGGNTAYGFRSFYDSELARMDNVILMKGAPGTGKSTLIKSVGAECAKRGLDHETWYCSGDPESADGIYVKALGAAVVDATSPHPCEAALPVIRERIVDMAAAMDRAAVLPAKKEITELINVKKRCYSRAYDKLKSAFCHYSRSEEAYAKKADIVAVRRAAAAFALAETDCVSGGSQGRNAFSKAITPNGIVAFHDHLAGRRVYMLDGGEHAAHVFLAEAAKLIPGGTVLHHPLLPERVESVLWKGCALTADAGPEAMALYMKRYDTPIAAPPDSSEPSSRRETALLSGMLRVASAITHSTTTTTSSRTVVVSSVLTAQVSSLAMTVDRA